MENVVFCLVAIDLNEVVLHVGPLTDAPRLFEILYLLVEGLDSSFFVHSLIDHLVDRELFIELPSHQLARLSVAFAIVAVGSEDLFFDEGDLQAQSAAFFRKKLSVERFRLPLVFVDIVHVLLCREHVLIEGFKGRENHRLCSLLQVVTIRPNFMLEVDFCICVSEAGEISLLVHIDGEAERPLVLFSLDFDDCCVHGGHLD